MRGNRKVSQSTKTRLTISPTFLAVTIGSAVIAITVGWLLFTYLNLGNHESVFAQNKSYTAIQTGLWTNSSTWSSGSIPPTTGMNQDNLTIDNQQITLNGDLDVNNDVGLTINNSGTLNINGDFVVNNNLTLTINGTLNVNGKIDIKNGGGITVNGGGNISTTDDIEIGNNANFWVDGNVDIGGSLSFGTNATFAGNGTVTIAGAGCDAWSGPGSCDDNMALPVVLLNFSAQPWENNILVSWKTAIEENNDHFTIQKSSNGTDWVEVGTLAGSGTTYRPKYYEFMDDSPLSGRSYYRLMQTDYDGKFEIFNAVMVDFKAEAVDFSIFPNPLKGNILSVTFEEPSSGVISITDNKGNQVHKEVVDQGSVLQMEIGSQIHPGNYVVSFHSDKSTKTKKLVKQ